MARDDSAHIRTTPSMIPKMETDPHRILHENNPPVPVPSHNVLRRVANDFDPTRSTLQTVDGLMLNIEQALKRPNIHTIERELGMLTVKALYLQRQYLPRETSATVIDLGQLAHKHAI